MDLVSLALFATAVVALGAAATVMIAKWLPQSAIEQAAQHGRFVGLGEAPRAQPARSVRPLVRPQVGKEAMNVVRTH
ncbi:MULTISPECIES: hypothetical protein [Paraburkholderia]|uniref:Uncharacterized protein n=1 Tax=Paraburkholderia tropica TaxID=92647 RepID=A0A1A5XMT5_9BURK|nr:MULTISPECIES: hypothetical protein [Paraburkholderia]MBB2978490.1 hypothetical protein [Paraburkholderia tropica]MBB2998684.1 hypothetical protein [Paraburkholderia tropica]MBB6318541.1 hypothetical protein [Paraburkholderia tropica]MDE1139458.1 hypothetical protein [Paraburkholderia tropica]OBR54458.1 hypothetical protein A6456_13035 [Paraburkholderia tropica]